MKNSIWQFPLTIVLSVFIAACGSGGGGGGSGGNDGIIYTGVTTQAPLTAANANTFFSLLWDGGISLGGISPSTSAAKVLPVSHSRSGGLVSLARIFAEHLPGVEAARKPASAKTLSSMVPINETVPGMVSGTMTLTGSIDDTNGRGKITIICNNFNDGDGYTYDGTATMQINAYDMMSGSLTDATISFTVWTVRSAASDVSVNGSMRLQETGAYQDGTMTMTLTGRDNLSQETFRFENFIITNGHDGQTVPAATTESYSGRLYDGRFGYIDISSIAPFIYADTSNNPASGGPLIFAGAANSRAAITPFEYGVRIEVDSNGDGTFEATNRYFWDRLTGPAFTSLTIAPAAASVPAGLTQHFTATGRFADNSTQELTSRVSWTSSDTNIAQISSREGTYSTCWDLGCAYAGSLGSATITATLGDMTGTASLEVAPAVVVSLDVHPLNFADSPSMAIGMSRQYEAVGTYSNTYRGDVTSLVTWSSANPGVATISNLSGSNGMAQALSTGTTAITATSGEVSASTALSVTAWQLRDSGVSTDIYRVEWGGSQFVATGADGVILTSSDGETFLQRSSGTSSALYDVASSGSTFVVVGANGAILTSSTGAAWTPQASGSSSNLYGVVWSGSRFVAVGAYGTVLTSTNGTAWTAQSSGSLNHLGRVAWSGDQFLAISAAPNDYSSYEYPVHTSPDGVTWTHRAVAPSFIWQSSDVRWCGAQFVIIGADGNIFTSGNGINWSSWLSGTGGLLTAVACSPTEYVVAGRGGMLINYQ